jgi:hypothetical protein
MRNGSTQTSNGSHGDRANESTQMIVSALRPDVRIRSCRDRWLPILSESILWILPQHDPIASQTFGRGGTVEPFALVNHAIEILIPCLPAAAHVGARVGEGAAAHALYEVVARKLRRGAENEALADFTTNPADSSLVRRLLRQAIRDDPQFAAELAAAVAAASMTVSTNTVSQAGNVVSGDMAGRDVVRNSSTTSTTHNKKTNNGGIVFGVVVIVAVIAACLIGRSLLNSASTGGLTASSTCQDYLQSADVAAKQKVMKKLYLDKNKPHLAADPFIIQNTEYFCGNSPKTTLGQLAAARQDG